MATPSINGTAVPVTAAVEEMGERGNYKFHPQEKRRENGQGDAIAAGPQRITWRWESLPTAGYTFWTSTILSGAASLEITSAELWDDEHNEVTFTGGVLYYPTVKERGGGKYYGVEIEIKHVTPLV